MTQFLKLKLFFFSLIFLSSFLLCQSVSADTHTVSGDCSATAVQTAINAASAGDIIDVTCTGTVTWSSRIILSDGKTLRGGGIKGLSGTSGTWPLIINVTYNSQDYPLIQITNNTNQPLNRLTGFEFQGSGAPIYIINSNGQGTGTDGYGAFRIDNNYFNDADYSSRLIQTDGSGGKLTGLVDNNAFYATSPNYNNITYLNSYKGSSLTCYGYDSYNRAAGFGTDDFIFYEDNYLHNSAMETSDGGGRVVVRYNEVNSDYTDGSMALLDGHGADTAGHNCIGIVANELYENTVTGSQAFAQIADMRGGQWMVHGNTTQSGFLQINEYRLTGPAYLDWNTCSGSACCIAACMQNPGIGDFASCYPLPNQVHNTFIWNNIKSGSNMMPAPVGGEGGAVDTYVALNRDYWMPAYGLESALPATCTTDSYYGATDSGKLWKCETTDNWTLQYTPYTYPHPLRSSDDAIAPTAPSGLNIS